MSTTTTAPTTRVYDGSTAVFTNNAKHFRTRTDRIDQGYYIAIFADDLQWLSPVFGDARELLERAKHVQTFDSGRVVMKGIRNVPSIFMSEDQHAEVIASVQQAVETCPVQQPEGVTYLNSWE